MKSIYKFKPDDAYRFANEQGIDTRVINGELRFVYCPYCRHNNPSYDRDTFAINLETGQFNCKRASCGAKGNMLTLANDFQFYLGKEVSEYLQPRRTFKSLRKYPRPAKSEDSAVEYMKKRGISREVAERYAITAHSEDHRRLCIPFYDDEGILQLVKYRNMDFKKGDPGNKEWSLSGCKPILFGMDQCDPEASDTLVMTEGQIDSLSVTEAGIPNAVSVPNGAKGFTWVPYCWDFLGKFKKLIVFGDYENGKISLLEEMKARFHGLVCHVREEDYRDCKDANDLLRKYGKAAVADAVGNAVFEDVDEVTQLADVEKKDLSKLPTIKTGLPTLDRTIGGLFLGSLVIVTGERGNGKSTLASQIVSQAISQGYISFIYSGELMNWIVLDWIDRQVCGSEHINALRSNLDYVTYSIEPEVVDKIHDWYRDKVYIYDMDKSLEMEKHEELEGLFEKVIRIYGCQVLMIDNLMTAMSDDLSSDLYRQQSNFIKYLAILAKKYNVMILLVAHPKKSSSDQFKNDDVFGSSNITNLTDVILHYGKPKEDKTDPAPPDRVLRVTKNRLNGKTIDSIRLWFEESSKRISEDATRFDWDLGWNDDEWSDDLDVIPF